jgi:hypothetical protein
MSAEHLGRQESDLQKIFTSPHPLQELNRISQEITAETNPQMTDLPSDKMARTWLCLPPIYSLVSLLYQPGCDDVRDLVNSAILSFQGTFDFFEKQELKPTLWELRFFSFARAYQQLCPTIIPPKEFSCGLHPPSPT